MSPSWCSAFESGDHPPDAWMARALECCADHRGTPEPAKAGDAHLKAQQESGDAFIRMPYAREFLTPAGLINDTFETAITWDRFESFHDKVKAATERAILEATGLKGEVTCRFTHVYPDGPAPYFSFHALGRHGALLEQWQAIKNAASDTLIEQVVRSRIIMLSAVITALVRPTAAGAFRRRISGSKARTGSTRHAQPGSADRSVDVCRRKSSPCSRSRRATWGGRLRSASRQQRPPASSAARNTTARRFPRARRDD